MRDPRIAVVGGGPAGASCARLLAGAGFEVTLFEARCEAEKPCGGGVPAGALREFPLLADPSLERRIVQEVILFSPSNRRVRVRVPGGIHVFRRRDLDTFLRDKAESAGAVLRRMKVTGVQRSTAGWELQTPEGSAGPFEYLVGADGVRGIVRRHVAEDPRFEEDDLTLALYGYVAGVPRPEMTLKFFGGFHGYLWVFPRSDHLSVGICARYRETSAGRLEDEAIRFLDAHYPGARVEPGALRGYLIPASPQPPAARSDGTWALIGDAGGFVDPLTREGISHAMRSAAAVARRIIAGTGARTPAISDDLALAHRYGSGFYQERFLERMTRLASASSTIRKVLADLFAGHQGYRGLKGRLLMSALPCGLEVGVGALAKAAGGYRGSPSQ